MNLSFLLEKIGVVPISDHACVAGVTDRFEEVVPGCVFVCVSGDRTDGHSFAAEALDKGAAAVIGERNILLNGYYNVRDSRTAFSILCSAFFGDPGKKLRLIGITGTNGKTSVAEYTAHILEKNGHKCGLIGTLGVRINGGARDTGFTTPEGSGLYGALAEMVDAGCEFCVMEVSSQALAQKRVEPLRFEIGAFLNLSGEHLDYHRSMSAYAEAKGHLAELSDTFVINSDDAYAEKIASFVPDKKIKYISARNGLADYMANNIKYENGRISYVLFCRTGVARVGFDGLGEFTVYNSLAAAAICITAGLSFDGVTSALVSLPGVPGRAELLRCERGVTVCVDYAHTPDALSNILLALSAVTENNIITVFGCGGDRDRSKRPLMGRIAANMSSAVILTNDNPRSEDPAAILEDIKSGIRRRGNVFTEPDRKKAIELALNKAEKGDTVLIAGKGHEKSLITDSGSVAFGDMDCVRKIIGLI